MRDRGRRLARYRSWPAFCRDLEGRIPPGVRLLSFDVFDTLIIRRLHPSLVIRGSAREVARRLEQRGRGGLRDPLGLRGPAHDLIAARNEAAGWDREAALPDTLATWIKLVGEGVDGASGHEADDQELAREIEEFEVENEILACAPNEPLARWIERMRAAGYRTVFCSDMYLGERNISTMLARYGLRHLFDAGYVSATCGYLKRTGRLFERLVEGERVAPHEVLHVGDDPKADDAGAVGAGCWSVLVQDRDHRRRQAVSRFDNDAYEQDPGWAGVIAAGYSRTLPFEATEEERLGYQLLGPLFAAHVHKVAETCRDSGVRHVYFLAREGHVLKTMFDELTPLVWPNGGAPASSYLYVSRLTALLAAAKRYGLAELSAALVNHPFPTVRTVLGPFGLPEDALRRTAARHGISEIDAALPPFFREWAPFQRLLDDPEVVETLDRLNRRYRVLLEQYLRQHRFFDGGVVALVDIGWGGQTQDHLRRAFGDVEGFPTLLGLYAGTQRFAHWREAARSHLRGLLAEEPAHGWHASSLFYFTPSLETVLRAPHGTTVDYRQNGDGRVEPVFRSDAEPPRQAEQADDPCVALLQAGILRYVREYARCARVVAFSADETIAYARTCAARLLRYPTSREARLLCSFVSVCDMGLDVTRWLGDVDLGLAYWQKWRHPRRLLRRSLWRPGTLTLLLGRGLRHPFILWHALATASRGEDTWTRPAGPIETQADRPHGNAMTEETELDREIARAWDDRLAKAQRDDRNGRHLLRDPLGFEYVVASAVTRRLANALCSLRGKRIYVADGLSHRRLLRRLFAGWID
jgi:FMN phosphatase YigB (HAD superfamily)